MKQREGNYINPGVVGRATGTTVPDLGPRDEHGMEPISKLFSSPEKSPPKRNGVLHHSTIDDDEDETMNIGSSMSSNHSSMCWETRRYQDRPADIENRLQAQYQNQRS